MKILLLIIVAFVLIVGALEANGERVTLVNRQLLSDANFGRKVNVGANDQKGNLINGNKGIGESGESRITKEREQKKSSTDGNGTGDLRSRLESSTSSSHHFWGNENRDKTNP